MTHAGESPSILVVDDDDEFRHTLVDALCFEGRQVHSVRDGQQALDWLATRAHQEPCAILLDIMMPVMDGKAFLARLAADPRLTAIPVVVLTAGGDCRELRQTYQFTQCLPKTASLATILAALDSSV